MGETVSLSASASGVDYVKFYVKNTSTGASDNPGGKITGGGYSSTSWSTGSKAAGSYLVRVVGYNSSGQELTDDQVYIDLQKNTPMITQQPAVTIVNPGQGAVYTAGSVVKIDAIATDDVKVLAMGLYINNETQPRVRLERGSLSYEWNTSGLSLGQYIIKITAWDGSLKAEESVTISLKGSVPEQLNGDVQFLGVNVEKNQGYVGDIFKISANITGKPDLVYLQFNDPSSDWLDKKACRNNFRMTPQGTSYIWEGRINTPGAAGNNHLRYFKVFAEKNSLEVVKEGSFTVLPKQPVNPPTVNQPLILITNVSPERGYQGQIYVFTAKVKGNPQYVYIQFDNPGNGWLDKESCNNNFRFTKTSSNADGTETYTFERKLSTPGLQPQGIRSYKVYAVNGAGESEPYDGTFVIHPNELPVIKIISPEPTKIYTKGKINVKAEATGNSVAMNLYLVESDNIDKGLLPAQAKGNTLDVNVPFDKSGFFTLKVTSVNSEGKSNEKTVQILVGDPEPRITGGPKPSFLTYGLKESKTVEITGSGFVSYSGAVDVVSFVNIDNGNKIFAKVKTVEQNKITVSLNEDMPVGKYNIWIKNSKSGLSDYVTGFEIKPIIIYSLPAPQVVTIQAQGPTQVKITWNPVPGAASYTIFRTQANDGSKGKYPNQIATTFIDNNVKPAITYYYAVVACTTDGLEGKWPLQSLTIRMPGAIDKIISVPKTVNKTVTSGNKGTSNFNDFREKFEILEKVNSYDEAIKEKLDDDPSRVNKAVSGVSNALKAYEILQPGLTTDERVEKVIDSGIDDIYGNYVELGELTGVDLIKKEDTQVMKDSLFTFFKYYTDQEFREQADREQAEYEESMREKYNLGKIFDY